MTKNLQKQLPAPHSPIQCWKIVKFKLLSHEKCEQHCTGVGRGKMRGEQNCPTLMAKVVGKARITTALEKGRLGVM